MSRGTGVKLGLVTRYLLHDEVLAAADVLRAGVHHGLQEAQVGRPPPARLHAVHEVRHDLLVRLVRAQRRVVREYRAHRLRFADLGTSSS